MQCLASAVQLALALGARTVFAVDINHDRLALAEQFGANPVQADSAVEEIRKATGGRGVDVSVELLGLSQTVQQAIAVLAPMGRAAVAGITEGAVPIEMYRDIVGREAVLVGSGLSRFVDLFVVLCLSGGERRGGLQKETGSPGGIIHAE